MSCSDNLRKEKFSLTQFTAGASSFCMFYHRFQLKISHTLLLIWTYHGNAKLFQACITHLSIDHATLENLFSQLYLGKDMLVFFF